MSTEQAAIITEYLGKRYLLRAGARAQYVTLRDSLTRAVTESFRSRPQMSSSQHADPGVNSRELWALRDVSLTVQEGSVLGVIGVNGAGKSTLLKILSRITPPTTGRIRLRGRVASLLEVGTGFHRELSGRENIFLNGAILGMGRSEIRAKFDEIVAFAEVEAFVDTPVKYYSSGMYVRLAFAVAAHLEPEILLVDEVLAVGDAKFQRRCLGKMQEVSRDHGRTVLFVSHTMPAVRALCDRVIWLDRGSIAMQGSAGEVIREYLRSTVEIAEGSFSLASLPRHWPGHGEAFRLDRITINDGQPVLHGESFKVFLEYTVTRVVQNVAIEIGLSSAEGVRLVTIDSNLESDGHDLGVTASGSVSADLARLLLEPGRYSVDVAVRSGDHAGLDYVPGCVWIQVLPGPTTPPPVLREGGGVRIPATWSWEREAET